jgi:hypothetical protein
MSVEFVNAESQTTGAGQTITITKPTNTADNDFMLCFLGTNNQTIRSPEGWNLWGVMGHDTGTVRAFLYWKIASGEGASYVWDIIGGQNAILIGSIVTYRNCTQIRRTEGEGSLTSTDPATTPTVTTDVPCKLLYYAFCRDDVASVATFTTSGAATERFDVGDISTVNYSHAMYEDNAVETQPGTITGLSIDHSATPTHRFHRTIALSGNPVAGGSLLVSNATHNRASRW